jgi:hypothetical protein
MGGERRWQGGPADLRHLGLVASSGRRVSSRWWRRGPKGRIAQHNLRISPKRPEVVRRKLMPMNRLRLSVITHDWACLGLCVSAYPHA